MHILLYRTALLFSAGAFGGLINSLTVWLFGIYGINAMLSVPIQPDLTPQWLYPRLVWGGLWGAIFFLLEFRKNRPSFLVSSIFASIGPSLGMFLVVFPHKVGKGYFGLDMGDFTPMLVLFFNFVWALATLLLFRYLYKNK